MSSRGNDESRTTYAYVVELTEPHTWSEPTYTYAPRSVRLEHVTRQPPLVTQLYTAIEASSSAENGVRAGYMSKPAARIDAIDAASRIDHEAAMWVRVLGEDDPGDTIACIRQAYALVNGAGGRQGCDLEHDIRRWWATARVLTGWDAPAWKPDNTCPLCGVRGGLRVRPVPTTAVCVECGEAWDAGTIGLLADHIRAENADLPVLGPACTLCDHASCVDIRVTASEGAVVWSG